jgi:hypothetical protein
VPLYVPGRLVARDENLDPEPLRLPRRDLRRERVARLTVEGVDLGDERVRPLPVSPAEFDGVVTSRNPSRYTIDEEAAGSVAAQGPARSPSAMFVTLTAALASALTAIWNAQNSFFAHDSAMLPCAGGAGSVGRIFCVSRTALTALRGVAASALDEASEAASMPAAAEDSAMSLTEYEGTPITSPGPRLVSLSRAPRGLLG